jgi:hypothetical protein
MHFVPFILPDLLFITAERRIGTVYLTSTVLALFHKICTQAYKNQRIILKVIKREKDTNHGKKAAPCIRLKYGF